MRVLLICGVYDEKNEKEVLSKTKGYAEVSANIFQTKLINGLESTGIDFDVVSAPFIGAYPFAYKEIFFKGFKEKIKEFRYVEFNNLWGYRNISRYNNLKKEIRRVFKENNEEEYLILVYAAHTPFLQAAHYAKKIKPKSKICFICPDLPQYMNLNETNRGLYDYLKKYDIRKMQSYIDKVDSFVLLTEEMKHVLQVGDRPFIVAEGVVNCIPNCIEINEENREIIKIVYTGKMNKKFGIINLVNSFMKIEEPHYRLILCGDGDARDYVLKMSKKDSRIDYRGLVPVSEANRIIQDASVLVNPRPNNEEYTKYSFPSKNIEYLLSGKPLVAYMLDGMKSEYRKFIFEIPKDEVLFDSILKQAVLSTENEKKSKIQLFYNYAKTNLLSERIMYDIYRINDFSRR